MTYFTRALAALGVAAVAACGGSQTPTTDPIVDDEPVATVGQSTEPPVETPPGDPGAGSPVSTPETDPATGEPAVDPVTGETVTEEPAAAMPVTFRVTNSGAQDLTFSIDKGWQPVIFGMAGRTPLVLFPRACMSACGAPEEEVCPYCPTPDKPREEAKAEQRVVVAPGETFEKGWDGMGLAFEKTQGITDGAPSDCLCFSASEPEPAEYTIKACGFRVTDEPNKPSKLQCVETKLTLPLAETPTVVELDFPAPPQKKKRRRRR